MSTRGRRPKPTAVKEIAGNPGHRPLNESEPKPPASNARAPRGLGQEGSRFWKKYAPALAALNVLTDVDVPAFRMAAEHYEIAMRAAQELRVDELVIEGKDGPKKNPLAQILKDNSAALRSFLTEFGMTPASRSKLHTEAPEQPSLADELFRIAAERTADTTEDLM